MEKSKPAIVKLIKELGQEAFTVADMKQILSTGHYLIGLPGKISNKEFIDYLDRNGIVQPVDIKMPNGKKVIRFKTPQATAYELAQSLKGKSYLSHYTAVFLHGLTDNLPKTIYTNTELQKFKNTNSGKLEQTNIDRAFACNMRQSNQIAKCENLEIYLLNSKNVDQLGVKDIDFNGVKLRVTDIERTLIDITVRPNYAGGTDEVLNAYKAAKGKVSVNRLLATLKKLDYTYPYHQSIGFYLEMAGYDESVLNLAEKVEIKYNFYLTYKIKDKDYSARWKLFFPRGL